MVYLFTIPQYSVLSRTCSVGSDQHQPVTVHTETPLPSSAEAVIPVKL